MSNQANAVIDKVIANMSDKLSNEQLTYLEATLLVSLRGMHVEQECTELAPQQNGWDYYLSRFRATKRLKNCAESTIKQYDYAIGKLREYIPKQPQEIETNDIKYFLGVYGAQPSKLTKKLPSKTYLESRSDSDPALFVKDRKPNSRLTKTGAEYIIRELGKGLGIHAHPHRFRRTMITRCNRRGMSLQDIQTLAGHTNASTTQIYIDMQNAAVKASYERCS